MDLHPSEKNLILDFTSFRSTYALMLRGWGAVHNYWCVHESVGVRD